ncbi:MAG: PAS domain S-box protein [Promethearchaeota archaeon]
MTERKLTEKKLKESEERYKEIFNNIISGVAVFEAVNEGEDFIFMDFNLAGEKIEKVKKEEIIGKKVTEAFPGVKDFGIFKIYQRVYKTGKPEFHTEAICSNDKYSVEWRELYVYKSSSGEIVAVFDNITNRKQAELKIKESEEKYRLLFEGYPNMILLVDLNGKIIDVNPAMLKFFGTVKEHLIQHDFREIDNKYFSENSSLFVKKFRKLLSKGTIEPIEIQLYNRDWSLTWVDIQASLVKIGGKKLLFIIMRDVTNRKKREEQLKKFKLMVDSAHDAIFFKDLESRYIIGNNKTLEAFGLTRKEVIGKNDLELMVDEKEAKKNIEDDQEVFNTGKIKKIVKHMKGADGNEYWFQAIKVPQFNNDGNVIGLVGIARDITEQKKTEKELRESEEKYRKVFENTGTATIIVEEDTTISLANEMFEKLSGYSKKEIEWKKIWTEFVFKEDLKRMKNYHFSRRKDADSAPKKYEFRFITKEGDIREILLTVDMIPNTKKSIASLLDITERRKAEQKLKESEIKFREITEQSDIGIVIIQKTVIKYVNKTVSKIFGYTIQEIKEWNFKHFLNAIHPDDRSRAIKNLQERAFLRDTPKVPWRIITKSGETRWVNIYAKRIQIQEKEAVLATLIDITEKKKAEQELKEIDKLKSELLIRTSHELKTPLISIKGFADLLLNVHEEKFDTDTISILNEIKQGCSRLEKTINNLIETSKLESSKEQLNASMEDLSFLIKFCVNELRGLVEMRNHTINLNLRDKLIAKFEKEKIHDVISNLLINAIKYTPPSGEIEIQSEIKDDFIIISIKDNGIGFIEEEKKQIFMQFGKIERYGQGWDVLTEGSGLGLYISKKIVELHGGKIWAESEGRNKGSAFHFSLPIVIN